MTEDQWLPSGWAEIWWLVSYVLSIIWVSTCLLNAKASSSAKFANVEHRFRRLAFLTMPLYLPDVPWTAVWETKHCLWRAIVNNPTVAEFSLSNLTGNVRPHYKSNLLIMPQWYSSSLILRKNDSFPWMQVWQYDAKSLPSIVIGSPPRTISMIFLRQLIVTLRYLPFMMGTYLTFFATKIDIMGCHILESAKLKFRNVMMK